MDVIATRPSPQLLAANRRLLDLKSQHHALRQVDSVPPWEIVAHPPESATPTRAVDVIAALPSHLGWGSAALTRQTRLALTQHQPHLTECQGWEPVQPESPAAVQTPEPAPPQADHVKLYPDLALGMLRQEQATVGRIWLLLRHIDVEGRGSIRIDIVRATLSDKNASMRVCGWRQLRNLLRQGEGVFWVRDKSRLWLRSVEKVATSLEVPRLSVRPVSVPVQALLEGSGEVKAHFYASFHSGRRQNRPISRETLTEITSVPEATQRLYEERTRLAKQQQMAIGEKYTAENVEKRAWIHGNASFDFIDHHGRQGPKKRHYIAWHLPNTYEGCHQLSPRGRMKKINRRIDLVHKWARGNGSLARLFFPDGGAAGKAYNRHSGRVDTYWYSEHGRRKPRGMWYVLSRQIEGS